MANALTHLGGEAAVRTAYGALASSPAGPAASRRRTAKPSTFAGNTTPAQASHSAAGTPPSQPARRQRSVGKTARRDIRSGDCVFRAARSFSHSPPPTPHSLLRPRRLLLLQKRRHPFLPLGRNSPRGDRFDRVRDRIDQLMRRHVRDELLALAHRLGSRRF
jgi:hypothetical protein